MPAKRVAAAKTVRKTSSVGALIRRQAGLAARAPLDLVTAGAVEVGSPPLRLAVRSRLRERTEPATQPSPFRTARTADPRGVNVRQDAPSPRSAEHRRPWLSCPDR